MTSANWYEMQISFTAEGNEAADELEQLFDRLTLLRSKPLNDVYAEFKLLPLSTTREDMLSSVSLISKYTRTINKGGSFVVTTKTKASRHLKLWIDVCRTEYPHLVVNCLGFSSNGNSYCEKLYKGKRG